MNWIFYLLIFITPSASWGQASAPQVYCNGQPKVVNGDPVFANGRRMSFQGDRFYPNGVSILQLGDVVYPNGLRVFVGGEMRYMSGQKIVEAGNLVYPNGQRVSINGTCYFDAGTPRRTCPPEVDFEDEAEGVVVTGQLNLKNQSVSTQTFEFRQPEFTTTWTMNPKGQVSDFKTYCE